MFILKKNEKFIFPRELDVFEKNKQRFTKSVNQKNINYFLRKSLLYLGDDEDEFGKEVPEGSDEENDKSINSLGSSDDDLKSASEDEETNKNREQENKENNSIEFIGKKRTNPF